MNNTSKLSHLDDSGNPMMVNVAEKAITLRTAQARAVVILPDNILALVQNNEILTKKGAVFQTAIIAGIMAAKKTSELIPLCHPIGLEDCKIEISLNEAKELVILCTTQVTAKTGVEMEALTGASVAALTIYDMCKALSHHIIIQEIRLVSKTGGKEDFVSQTHP